MIDYLSKNTKAGKVTSLITAIGIGAYALGVGGCVATKCVDKEPKQETKYVAHEDYELLENAMHYIDDSNLDEPTQDVYVETIGEILRGGYIPSTEENQTTKTLSNIIKFLNQKNLPDSTSQEYSEAINRLLIDGYPKMGQVEYTEAEQDIETDTSTRVPAKKQYSGLEKTTKEKTEVEKIKDQTLSPKKQKPSKLEQVAQTDITSTKSTPKVDYNITEKTEVKKSLTIEYNKPEEVESVQIPDLSEEPDSTKVELTEKPEGVSETHWYNEGIFANKTTRWAAAGLAIVGLGYLVGDNNDWFQDDNGKGPIGPEPGVTGGRGDSISDAGTVRGGRGDKSGSDSGGNR